MKNNLNNKHITFADRILKKATGFGFNDTLKIVSKHKQEKEMERYKRGLSLRNAITKEQDYYKETVDNIIVPYKGLIVGVDGRDTAGKGSNIKKTTEYLENSRFLVKAFPGIPTAEEKFEDNWFKRYEKFFPENGDITFFDRSWYNRAFVEAAMGFCTEEEYNWFMQNVNDFEKNRIIGEGYDLLKIYLSVSKQTQKERLKRRDDILRNWKISPVDRKAQEKWNYYSLAKLKALELTDEAPWLVLDSNEKYLSTIEIIKAIINKNDEVSKHVSSQLDLDLEPNKKVARSAKEELELIYDSPEISKIKEKFNFRID